MLEQQQAVKCTHWREGVELADERDVFVSDLGKFESQTISADGFRVYTWNGGAAVLTGYDKGVKVTFSKNSAP